MEPFAIGGTPRFRLRPAASAPGFSFCLAALLVLCTIACRQERHDAVRLVPQIDPVQPRRVAFAPERDDHLLVVEATGLVGVWDLRDAVHPLRTAWIPAGAIDAAFTLDGREIVTAGWDGRIRWWDVGGRLLRASTSGHKGAARALGIGDGQVVSGGEDGVLLVWGPDGARRGEAIPAHEGFVVSAAIGSKGEIASAGTDQKIRLWERDSSSPSGYRERLLHQESEARPILAHLLKMDMHMGWDHSVAFSPRTGTLVAAGFDSTIRLWQSANWGVGKPLNKPNRHVRALAWAPRGDKFASTGFDGMVRLWNANGARINAIAQHPAPVLSVAFSASGKRLATTSIDDRVRLWTVDGAPLGELPVGSRPPVATVAFTEDGPLFASADPAGKLWRWHIDGSAGVELGGGPPDGTLALALSSAGHLFAGGMRGNTRLFRSNGVGSPANDLGSYIDAAEYSPRGDVLAIAGTAGGVQLLNASGVARTARFDACRETIHGFAFSPLDEKVAVLCDDGAARLWTLDGQAAGSLLEKEAGAARGIAISPTGQLLAAGGIDGVVHFWSLPARRLDADLPIGLNIEKLGVHRNGTWVLANRSTVFFFDGERRPVATALVTPAGVIVFTPDGDLAGSRGVEGLVRAIRADGTVLSPAETARLLAPAKVMAALHAS